MAVSSTGYQTPKAAMKDFRKWCVGRGGWPEIHGCMAEGCPIHPVRGGKTVSGISPLKTCRAKCMDCAGQFEPGVKDCEFTECSLYPFRMGKNPGRQGKGGNPQNFAGSAGHVALEDILPPNTCVQTEAVGVGQENSVLDTSAIREEGR